MKAAVVHGPGESPRFDDFGEPVVTEGRELVELVASGIHPLVRSLAGGQHYGSSGVYPLIPGVDAVARTADGVLIYTGYVEAPYGTLAERMAVPGGMRLPLPDGADPVAIAGGLNPGLSSWMPLQARVAEAGSLGTVVILGATGTAGVLAVQNARLLGAARVIGAGRSPAGRVRAAAAGAETVTLTGGQDKDAAALAAALAGEVPGLVLDFVLGRPGRGDVRGAGPARSARGAQRHQLRRDRRARRAGGVGARRAAAQPPPAHLRQRSRVGIGPRDHGPGAGIHADDRGRPGHGVDPAISAVGGYRGVGSRPRQRRARRHRAQLSRAVPVSSRRPE